MKISSIKISRYKSIKKPFILNDPGKIHLFIGANNAGKTNIIDAIHQLYNTDVLRYYDDKTDIEIVFTLISDSGKLFKAIQKGKTKSFYIDNKKITSKKAKEILDNHVIRIGATKPISITRLQGDYSKFRLKYKKEFSQFNNTLAKYIPQIQLSHIFDKDYEVQENNISRPFERLGDGFQQVFVILMYLFNPQYKILLLEEPEIHLHPALIKKLLKIFENRNYENQIFLTTHSPIFIHTTNLHRLFRVVKENNSTIVYSPRLVGKRLNYTRLKQELNAENSEMLFSDKVLLVEGPSDHILLRELIDRFYSGNKDIKVIQTYGKSNVDIYSELLEIFNIPYVVLLDRDALYDTGVKLLDSKVKQNFTKTETTLIQMLKKQNIFILPNGSIERNYPRKYQRRRKHKPQNAMYAATHITREEYYSPLMKNIKEVIDSL
ncbi:MAG: AAA family ATPase [bacterium]|nr:AAA family ATPase [bacterium]